MHMETIRIASELYLAAQLARGRFTVGTATNHRPAYRILARTAHSPDVAHLQEVDVDAWFAAQTALARATVRTRFSMLRGFARWTVRTGRCPADWTADSQAPKLARPSPRALEHDQAAALLDACPDERGRAIVALMLWCGLRCSEVSALDLVDWHRVPGLLRVYGKGDKQRTVPVPDELVGYLDAWLAVRGCTPGPFVVGYRWRAGERLSAGQVSKLVGAWCARAGIKRAPRDGVSAHACRHTCASDVLERCDVGTGLLIVRDLLGHEHLSTTEVYLRRARRADMAAAMAGRTYRTVQVA